MGSIMVFGGRLLGRAFEANSSIESYQLDGVFLNSSHLSSYLAAHQVLAVMGLDESIALPGLVPACNLGFEPIACAAPVEVWTSNRPVTYVREDQLTLAHDGETLMGVVTYEDSEELLTQRTQQLYDQIFASCSRLGYPNLYRMWNFIPRINELDASGLERYRAFCKGRAQAFFDDGHYAERMLPAGTGVGVHSGPVTVMFMAGQLNAHVNLENPRQLPAYHYPCSYGPKSPSFARATLVPRGDRSDLYVSGTSSIIGHETVCHGDLLGQAQTTFENIKQLISAENLARYGIQAQAGLNDLEQIKVYLRHPVHYEVVRELCRAQFAPTAEIVYLKADICRTDLLLEIEGVIRLSSTK